MSERQVRPGDLGVTRLLRIFAALSIVFLVALAIAPARSVLTEWRAVQKDYSGRATREGKPPLSPAIQQIWNPRLRVVDRCTSCHVGMGPGEPVGGDPLFAAHPPIPHDPAEIGCTLCHGGQGRATTVEAGHGKSRHWDEPLLEPGYVEAGCGSCHTHLHVPSEAASLRGEPLFRRHDCTACHRADGAGRGTAPDLTWAGVKGFDPDWHPKHEALAAAATGDAGKSWTASWGPVPAEDRQVLDEYLRSRVGAPRLLAGKALAHRLGCRGCHKINGVGGDDGPDLSAAGRKVPSDLGYAGVRGPHTLTQWMIEHFEDPARVIPGSQMPELGLSREDAEGLALYMLSLRSLDLPEEFWPLDRIRGVRFHEREFATDGASLYAAFCSGCHGPRGEGRRYPAAGGVVFPAIGNPAFLALASDDYLRKTIARGRPGRRMPAWGEKDGGLRPAEIEAIVAHVRSFAPGTPQPVSLALPAGDAQAGGRTFERNCAGCHGPGGAGADAPAIGNPAFLEAATDEYIAATVLQGRPGTSMRHFGQPATGFPLLETQEVADIVAFLRSTGTPSVPGSTP